MSVTSHHAYDAPINVILRYYTFTHTTTKVHESCTRFGSSGIEYHLTVSDSKTEQIFRTMHLCQPLHDLTLT